MTDTPQSDFKYIAVRNWGKYQERIGRRGDARRPFIKMSTSLDSDPDYSKLTLFQRQVLDACRRLIGLHGQNLHNDHTYIARAMCALSTDRPHIAHAMHTLITRGFLLLTNQRDPFSRESNDTIRNETRRDETIPPEAEGTEQEQIEILEPGDLL